MVKQKSHNVFSIQGRVVGVPSVRMSRQGDGGYVDVTLNVIEEIWDADTHEFVPSTTRVPLSYYSKSPSEDAGRLKSGYAVIIDGHVRGRSYTDGQGGQRLAADLRVDNVDVIEPFLSGQSQATRRRRRPRRWLVSNLPCKPDTGSRRKRKNLQRRSRTRTGSRLHRTTARRRP